MNTKKFRAGFTLVEILVAVAISMIIILVIGTVMADSNRGWANLYKRAFSSLTVDSLAASKIFDSIVRKSRVAHTDIAEDGSWVEVAYRNDHSMGNADRYARFYVSSGELMLETGTVDPKAAIETRPIAENVSGCVFRQLGNSLQMVLQLDDGEKNAEIAVSAVMVFGV